MDTSASRIIFDNNGICNYCTEYLEKYKEIAFISNSDKEEQMNQLINAVKNNGKGKPYDCIVGVSGGVDSSWVLVKAVELGLRPLAVHMDNGWNSELAQNNIANLVKKLNVDLYTHVIDWSEYRGLMQAFFDADVIDLEILYDNAMLGVNYKLANKYGIKHILFGTNLATEGVKIPESWVWLKNDAKNIRNIGKTNGVTIKTYPLFSTLDLIYMKLIKRIKNISLLDYFEYKKNDAIEKLEKDFNYKKYPYKHYESIFTRFYQGYILPAKFGVDKRKVHLSTLILTGQLDRDYALKDLEKLPFNSEDDLKQDMNYFLKKMNWTNEQLEAYISKPEVPHTNYPSEIKLFKIMLKLKNYFNL